jgi:hypothetical protein
MFMVVCAYGEKHPPSYRRRAGTKNSQKWSGLSAFSERLAMTGEERQKLTVRRVSKRLVIEDWKK